MIKKQIISTIAIVLFLFGLMHIPINPPSAYQVTATPQVQDPFTQINLEANAAYVFDILKQESIFELNAEAQLPLASLTKLMTALLAKEYLPEGLIIEISPQAVLQEGDNGLLLGERWLLKDLLNIMLVGSSNDAAYAISTALASHSRFGYGKTDDAKVVALMNKKARQLDLKQTYFLDPTGLDISQNLAGGYGSCRDMAMLAFYILQNHPEIFEVTRAQHLTLTSLDGHLHQIQNTNHLVNEIPQLIGGKTGFTDLAGGNLLVIFDAGINHPIIVVVMGSSIEGRFNDVRNLIDATFAKLTHTPN